MEKIAVESPQNNNLNKILIGLVVVLMLAIGLLLYFLLNKQTDSRAIAKPYYDEPGNMSTENDTQSQSDAVSPTTHSSEISIDGRVYRKVDPVEVPDRLTVVDGSCSPKQISIKPQTVVELYNGSQDTTYRYSIDNPDFENAAFVPVNPGNSGTILFRNVGRYTITTDPDNVECEVIVKH